MKITASGALSAIKAFREAMSDHTVSDQEIVKRSEVCQTCPMRRDGHGVAENISKVLGTLANRHRVPSELADSHCGVCGCSLMLLVPATKRDLHKDSAEESANRPAGCWIKTSTK